ncbi:MULTISPECIES: peptidyl-tRNA hydrolase [unclassified Arthrobacter]|uniref:peptidyl-tRNA hydrolase n=1 Tax=unclassified Arthrobacter TaxID=235627 RepID=UPI001E51FEE4|nr:MULTISPECIES: peptidyl-tRNA hydrolase [unclassified Arthrobacter]MCC9145808.1 hypothetical protein [Arthrobacter sp. zg-Y919]MDK1277037.1 peptidyl-tRNA hydrolase [Arthrobacter sp. zg.Y919]WIB03566.1 peptidyl-tRNA hydrolase [Arthrobacter sp. zg-Y919]
MQPFDKVQPIVLLVDKTDPAMHRDAVAAAAVASVRAYMATGDSEAWENWLYGRFTKTVRRANPSTFDRLAAHAPSGPVAVGEARAIAFQPVTYEQMPKNLAKLQVSGTQLPDGEPAPWPEQAPVIVLNADLEMSTGKASAQAAHALLSWYLALEPAGRQAWQEAGAPAGVRFTPGEQFAALAARPGAGPLIVDAGMTEIAPDTATAFVASASFSTAAGSHA